MSSDVYMCIISDLEKERDQLRAEVEQLKRLVSEGTDDIEQARVAERQRCASLLEDSELDGPDYQIVLRKIKDGQN